jgi:DNA repair ATPase RecN
MMFYFTGIPQNRKNSKINFFISESDIQSVEKVRSVVTLKKGGEEYIKIYDATNRKTVCELNGKKITIKNVTLNLKGDVRFWSAESIFLLDPGPSGFVNYVDKNLCENGSSLLPILEEVYASWTVSYEELLNLRLLKKRKDDDDEVETFSSFLDDVGAFELKIHKVLIEIIHNLNEINDALFSDISDSHDDGRSSTSAAGTAPSVVDNLIDLITESLPELRSQKRFDNSDHNRKSENINDTSGKGRNEVESKSVQLWSATLSAYDFLSTFFQALDGSLSTPENKNTNLGTKNRNKEKVNIQEFGFDTISTIIEEYENKIIDLQKEFRSLNFPKTVLDSRIENLHDHFQSIESSVAKAKKEIHSVQNCLPLSKTNDLISKVQILKSECDKLCRRHDAGSYSELQKKMGKWESDKNQMENLIFTLPESENQEMKHREKYTEIAMDLTELRIIAANNFIRRINNLLPQLEMKDKHIGVRFDLQFLSKSDTDGIEQKTDRDQAQLNSLFDVWRSHQLNSDKRGGDIGTMGPSDSLDSTYNTVKKEMVKLISRNLKPRGEITARGWDDVSLSVRPSRETPDTCTPETPVSTYVRVALKNSYLKSTFNADNEEGEEEVDDADGSLAVSVLSSGESTRLALAMETCTRSAAASLETFQTPAGTPGHPPDTGPESVAEVEASERAEQSGLRRGLSLSGSEPRPLLPSDSRSPVIQNFESLLIFDEIDAHIGGEISSDSISKINQTEINIDKVLHFLLYSFQSIQLSPVLFALPSGEAALAVAKLLKEQGKWRQVVVVTHNPLVASLADKHFVVSKSTGESRKKRLDLQEENTTENHRNAEGDGEEEIDTKNDRGHEVDSDCSKSERRRRVGLSTSSKSTLAEVRGVHREMEISRMATGGGVHSAAGLALARALLGSSDSGRVSSLD